jgi:hypothetical protein
MQRTSAAVVFSFVAGSGVAAAQSRPLTTEEATTAPAGTLTLELGAQAMRAEPNFLTGAARDRYDGPLFRLVYSPADRVEMDVEWTARVGVRDDPDFGSVSDFGDVVLRSKVRFGAAADGPAVAARFAVSLPETSFGNGLGPNTLRMSADLLVSVPVGRGFLHGNAGLAIQDEPMRAHEQRDFLAYGAALVLPTGALDVVAEVAGLAGKGAPGADARHEARAGLRFGRGRVRGDVAVRRGLGDADGTWGLTAGATIVLRRTGQSG